MLTERKELSVLMLAGDKAPFPQEEIEQRLQSKFRDISVTTHFEPEKFLRDVKDKPFDVIVINEDLNLLGGPILLRELHLKDEDPLILVVQSKSLSAESAINILSSGCASILLSDGAPSVDALVSQTSSLLRFKRSQHANELYRARQSELLRLLTEKNKRLEEFAMTLAHDIRGPLGSISMNLEYVMDKFYRILPDRVTDVLKKIMATSDRVTNLVQGMYTYAKLGSQASQKEMLHLEDLVKGSSSDLHIDARLDITVGIDSLPEVWGSKVLLQRVFLNLLSNAIKYNDKSHILINIGVENTYTDKLGKFAVIYVEDNGPGIPESGREKLLEMFERGTVKEDGLGVGLGIVSRIIELHYGTVTIGESSLGGARFSFSLPLSPIQEESSCITGRGEINEKLY